MNTMAIAAWAVLGLIASNAALSDRAARPAGAQERADYIYCMLRATNDPAVRTVYMSEIFRDDYLKTKETWTNPFWRYIQREHRSPAWGPGYCFKGETHEDARRSQQRHADDEERSGGHVVWTLWSF